MFIKKFGLIALILCIFLTIGYFAVNTGAVSTVLLAIQGSIIDGNLVKFSGTNGIGVDAGLSATNIVKCKFDATSVPTVNNDVDEGYAVGSVWVDVTNDKGYLCLDNTDGAAVWTEVTLAGSGYTNLTSFVDQTAWRVFYSNADGDVIELALGTDGQYLKSTGATSAPIFDTPTGAGDMLKATYDTDEDGDIDVAAGGTEKSSWTLYAIPYLSGTTAFGEIAIGTAEYALTVNAGANGYDWTLFDLSLYYLKTEIDTLSEVETIYTKDIIDSDELAALKFTDLDDTPANYTGQAGKYVKVNAGETDLEFGTPTGAGTYLELTDTPAAYDNGKYAKSTADGVVWDDPAGAGDMLKATYDIDEDGIVDKSETVDDGVGNSSTAADVKDAVTKKHSANADTDLDATFEATFVKKTDTVNVLSDITSTGANIEDAVTKKHTQNTDTDLDSTFEATFAKKVDKLDVFAATTEAELYTVLSDVDEFIEAGDPIERNYYSALGSDHTYSANADVDSQPVGEAVVFGDLLYFNWTDKEWLKADADLAAKMPGLRIALESKTGGQTCLMLVKGYIRDDDWDFAGAMIYTSVTPGAMSSTAPTETGDQVQRVGVAKSADILFFDPSIDVGEI